MLKKRDTIRSSGMTFSSLNILSEKLSLCFYFEILSYFTLVNIYRSQKYEPKAITRQTCNT